MLYSPLGAVLLFLDYRIFAADKPPGSCLGALMFAVVWERWKLGI